MQMFRRAEVKRCRERQVLRCRCRRVDVQRCRGVEVQRWCRGGAEVQVQIMCRFAGLQMCRCAGVQVCRCAGVQMNQMNQMCRWRCRVRRWCRGAEVLRWC